MPAKKHGRPARTKKGQARRQPPPRRPLTETLPDEEAATGVEAAPQGAVTTAAPPRTAPPPRTTPSARTSAGTRARTARAPAQIVIANYEYLHRDLRRLAILAPVLVIVMVILSFVLH